MRSTTARPVELTGRLVRPGDTNYPDASAGFNLVLNHEPTVIVTALETQDVVQS